MNWKICLTISFLFLAGCRHDVVPTPEPEPYVMYKYVYLDCGNPPERQLIDFKPLQWTIVEGGNFALTPEGYKDLSYNISQIILGTKELKNEIKFYEDCLAEDSYVE